MINNRDEYIQKYWKYYCMLEKDFIELTRYVDIRESNFKTSSEIIIRQLQSVGSEFEVVCKELGNIDKNKQTNIKHYYEIIKSKINKILTEIEISDFREIEVCVRRTNNLNIKPFKNWDSNECSALFWWKGYNKIKHSRTENYEMGNLENLLNALGGLYIVEKLLLRKVSFINHEMDIADNQSELFYIPKMKIKWLEDRLKKKVNKEKE